MRASRDSLAVQPQYAGKKEQRQSRQLREVPRRRRRLLISKGEIILAIAVVSMLGVFNLFGQMQVTQLTDDITRQTALLDELAAESVMLSTRQAGNLDLNQVEQYATGTLGMMKLDSSQVEYVELTRPDHVTVSKAGVTPDQIFSGIRRTVSAVVEYLR